MSSCRVDVVERRRRARSSTTSLRTSGSTASFGTVFLSSSRATKPLGRDDRHRREQVAAVDLAGRERVGDGADVERHELARTRRRRSPGSRRGRTASGSRTPAGRRCVMSADASPRSVRLVRPYSSAASAVQTMTSLSSAVDGVSTSRPSGSDLAERGDLLVDVGRLGQRVGVVLAERRTTAASSCTRGRGRPRRSRWRRSRPRGRRCRARRRRRSRPRRAPGRRSGPAAGSRGSRPSRR